MSNPDVSDLAQASASAPIAEQRAMIHIGASAISMVVYEDEGNGGREMEVLEMLEMPLPLAEDIFRDALLSRGTIERCVRMFDRFQETLDEYGLLCGDDRVEAVVTNLLSEADNAEVLLNRLQVACGFHVRSLDEGDMTRLVYLSVAHILRSEPELNKRRVLTVHVGPGNTRLMLFKRGRIVQYNSFRMGAYRVADTVERMASDSDTLLDLIDNDVNGTIERIVEAYADEQIDEVLAIGNEIQPVAQRMTGGEGLMRIERKELREVAKRLSSRDPKEIAEKYNLNAYATRPLLAGVVCNLAVVAKFGLSHLSVPSGRFEEHFLMGLAGSEFTAKRFIHEVIGSAKALAKKYQADRKHGRHVAALAVKLFDELTEVLGLQSQDRILLEVAGVLHEVGSFISRRSHHKHSFYIIKNSEIFGLNDEETTLVALIARYHRHALPQPSHPFVQSLTRENRIRLTKLAALLRVADALDRSHKQQLQIQRARVVRDQLLIDVGDIVNVSVESLAMRAKGDLFEQVFGLEIVLETS